MKGISISSPETERKVAFLASSAFLVAAWLLLAGFFAWVFIETHPKAWGAEWCVVPAGLLAILFIPLQLIRYFRQMRTGNPGTLFKSKMLDLRQPQRIKWWNWVFAFVVACIIPFVSVYINSYFVMWTRISSSQVVNPLAFPEDIFLCIGCGAISFPVLIPFLRFRLLRWCVALILCALWLWLGLLEGARWK